MLFEASGSLLTTTDAGLHRWPIRADPVAPRRLLIGPPEPVPVKLRAVGGRLAQDAGGRVLAAGSIDGGFVWPRDSPGAGVRLTPHTECWAIAVSPDGTLVATGSQARDEIKVWDAKTGRLLRELLTGK